MCQVSMRVRRASLSLSLSRSNALVEIVKLGVVVSKVSGSRELPHNYATQSQCGIDTVGTKEPVYDESQGAFYGKSP